MAAEVLSVSRLQRRVLVTFMMLAFGLPFIEHVVAERVTPRETLYRLGGTTGPYAAERVNGELVLGDPRSGFKPGELVGWRSELNVKPGTSAITEVVLSCKGQDLFIESARLLPTDVRSGWKTNAMRLPPDAAGACEIRRRADFLNAAGDTESVIFPAKITFTVEASK